MAIFLMILVLAVMFCLIAGLLTAVSLGIGFLLTLCSASIGFGEALIAGSIIAGAAAIILLIQLHAPRPTLAYQSDDDDDDEEEDEDEDEDDLPVAHTIPNVPPNFITRLPGKSRPGKNQK